MFFTRGGQTAAQGKSFEEDADIRCKPQNRNERIECCNRKKDEQPDSVDAPQEVIVRLHDLYMESVVTNFKPLIDAVRNQEVVIYSVQVDEGSLTYGLDDEDAAKTLAEMESTRDRIANDPAFVAL